MNISLDFGGNSEAFYKVEGEKIQMPVLKLPLPHALQLPNADGFFYCCSLNRIARSSDQSSTDPDWTAFESLGLF